MNWYPGSIAEAVNLAKNRNLIFVVYVEGNDELSQRFRNIVNEEKIRQKLESDKFIAIRIESGTQAYMQFAQIYQLVPLPSLFFIGKDGTPLEIATSVITSADELENKINKVLELSGFKEVTMKCTETTVTSTLTTAANESAKLISSEQIASTSNVQCENGVCQLKSKTLENDGGTKAEEVKSNENVIEEEQKEVQDFTIPPTVDGEIETKNNENQQDEEQNKAELLKKLLEEKRKEKEAEEERLEREKEINRRKEGQEMQNLKKWKHEMELKELQENIRRQRVEEQAARKRILEQIASDRAERAQRFNQSVAGGSNASPGATDGNSSTNAKRNLSSPQKPEPDTARIQFRKPDGENTSHSFKSSETFQVVLDHVRNVILNNSGIREFRLCTTFPKREFGGEDNNRTLSELGLCPTSVLLIIAGTTTGGANTTVSTNSGYFYYIKVAIMALLSPFTAIYEYFRGFWSTSRGGRTPTQNVSGVATGAQKRASEEKLSDHDLAKKRNLERFMKNSPTPNEATSTGSDTENHFGSSTSQSSSLPLKSVAYKRYGSNVHRLREQNDSDDENNTWNGNSTQQQ